MSQVSEPSVRTTESAVPTPRAAAEAAAAAPPPTAAPPPGDPAMVGLPSFLVGSTALGLVLVGFTPDTAVGASIPIVMTATGVGLLIATVWAARLQQSAVAGVFGVFAGFWFSYAALVLGLTHNWFAILPEAVARTQELFLIAWLVVIGLLTVATLRLPAAFTGLFVLVEVALALVLVGTISAEVTWTRIAGYAVFAFAAVGAYLYVSGMMAATGGRPLPTGRPLMR
jgi:succinate-acetate transporter protein